MKILSSNIQPNELFSNFVPNNKLIKILHFPLLRVFLIAIFFVPIIILNSLIAYQVIANLNEPTATYVDIVRMLISIPLFLLSYHFYCQIIEKRDAVEVSLNGAAKQWGSGALVASLLVFIFVALIALFGDFSIIDTRTITHLFKSFVFFSIGALFQEVLLLCVIYRLLEELSGSWFALLTSLLLFAGIHLLNENETLLSAFMLMLSSLIFIAPFILTRRIWLSWGFHTGWNFMQAGIFGMANSGVMFEGWLITKIEGPQWITGGDVGLEATYLSVGIDFLIGILILRMAMQRGMLVAFRWNNKPITDS